MATELLPGSEFRSKLLDTFPNLYDKLVHVVFDYMDSITTLEGSTLLNDVLNFDYCIVGSNPSDPRYNIKAYVSGDMTYMYVLSYDDIVCNDAQLMFYNMKNLCRVEFNNFETSECKSFRKMFMGCTSLGYVDFASHAVKQNADVSDMFSGCLSCKWIDIDSCAVRTGNYDGTCSGMFYGTTSLRQLKVGHDFNILPAMNLPDKTWYNSVYDDTFSDGSYRHPLKTTTYYSTDVRSTENDNQLVTVETLKQCIEQVAQAVSRQLRYNSEQSQLLL